MTDQEQTAALIEAVNDLASRTDKLTEKVNVAASISSLTRKILFVVIGLILVVGSVGTYQWVRVTNLVHGQASVIQDNQDNAVRACENGNEQRAASTKLWETVIGLSAVDAAPAEKAALASLLVWVQELYQQHDCSDLDKVYEIPDPPKFDITK